MNTNLTCNMSDEDRKKVFSRRLKDLMKEKEIDQTGLAEELNLSQQAISNWVKMKNFPDIGAIMDLCCFFECNVDYLLGNINATTHDTNYICEKTGLSEKAVEKLTETDNPASAVIGIGLERLLSSDNASDFLAAFIDYVEYHDRHNNIATIQHEDDAITSIPDVARLVYNGKGIDAPVVKQAIMFSLQSTMDKISQEKGPYELYDPDTKKWVHISYGEFLGEPDNQQSMFTTKYPEEVVFDDPSAYTDL